MHKFWLGLTNSVDHQKMEKIFPENKRSLTYVSTDLKQVLFVCLPDKHITYTGDWCLVIFSSCGLGTTRIQDV